MGQIIPVPRVPVNVRVATLNDVPFIDGLQKKHSKMVGWMPTKQLEGKIGAGDVIVADDAMNTPVGYCIGTDRYFKREDVGIIYQMNVLPGRQRGLIGATLLKAMFERSAYGCRLFCCWCAQDIEANRFWESMGFVPLAYRAGSRGRGEGGSPRMHIFWQKRIREGDTETPWWFPSQTSSGAIREDRIVLPIPPGVKWSDEMPVVLPGETRENPKLETRNPKQIRTPKSQPEKKRPPETTAARGLHFFVAPAEPAKVEKPKREKKPKVKNDPKLIAAARELRDRWLEHVNGGAMVLESAGKYDVARALPEGRDVRLLPAA